MQVSRAHALVDEGCARLAESLPADVITRTNAIEAAGGLGAGSDGELCTSFCYRVAYIGLMARVCVAATCHSCGLNGIICPWSLLPYHDCWHEPSHITLQLQEMQLHRSIVAFRHPAHLGLDSVCL